MQPFDDLLTSFLAEQDVPGAAVAVGRAGKVVYARGFGYADVERKQPVKPGDLFRVASLSKPITAVAVLRLAEREKLSLDDSAFGLLGHTEFRDPRMKRISVRHLLQHTGGFDRDESGDPMFQAVEIAQALGRKPPASAKDVIRYMQDRPLDFEPGARYAYSNFGYNVLGRIVEQVSGRSYVDHVKQELFRPLGIRDAHLGRTRLSGRRRNEVRYYTADEETGPSVFANDLGQPVPEQYGAWHLEAMDAHGGWLMSAADLVRFAGDVTETGHSKLLSPASIGTLFARPPGDVWHDEDGKPRPHYYACGWNVRPVGESGRNVWHMGGLPGTSTLLVRRHDGLVWAVLFNTRDTRDGKAPASLIDPLMHRAADAVEAWPE